MIIKYLCSLFCVFAAILFIPSSTAAQDQDILYSKYLAAGGQQAFSDVISWRAGEKNIVKAKISGLPEQTKKDLIESAERALKEPWSQILLSDYREFQENGNRVNFERLYFSRRTKLSSLCAGELVSGTGKYIPEIVNGLWLILEESTWVLPAHHGGNIGKAGPDPAKPLLDLFTAETAAHLAWVSLLFEEELKAYAPPIVERIESEINHRIVQPYLATDDYWWMGFKTTRKQNNWNIWINSNLLKVASLNMKDQADRNALIKKTIQSADKFLATYPADGGCDEGPAYWSAAGGALGEFVNMLGRVSEGKLNFSDNALIHNIGQYIYKVHIDSTRFVNFADAPGLTLPDPGRVYNFGEMYNDVNLKQFASYLARLSPSASGMLGASSINVFASNVRITGELLSQKPIAPMPAQNWLPDLEVLNLRKKAGQSEGLTFMAKGGHNGESHNHNDIGNFMLYRNGSPVLIDLGKGTYTRQTFSPDRYKLWYNQSQWHSTPQVNGIEQQAGENFKASGVVYKAGDKRELLSMDLAPTYPTEAGVKSWLREFTYDRRAENVILRETYELSRDSVPAKLHFIACKAPIIIREGSILLNSIDSSPAVEMKYDPSKFNATIEEKTIDDGSLRAVWGKTVYRITLESRQRRLKSSHQIEFHTVKN